MIPRYAIICLFVTSTACCAHTEPDAAKYKQIPATLAKMRESLLEHRNEILRLHKVIQANPDKKSRPEDTQAMAKLADDLKSVLKESAQLLKWMKTQDSATAFVEVFQALDYDLQRLLRHLKSGDAGTDAQALTADIIETLQEMINGFKSR